MVHERIKKGNHHQEQYYTLDYYPASLFTAEDIKIEIDDEFLLPPIDDDNQPYQQILPPLSSPDAQNTISQTVGASAASPDEIGDAAFLLPPIDDQQPPPQPADSHPNISHNTSAASSSIETKTSFKRRPGRPAAAFSWLQCDICGHGSRYRSQMLEHMRRAHIKERHFTCALCPRAYKTKSSLDAHVFRMHKTHKRRPAADQLQYDTAVSPVQNKRRPGRPAVGFRWCDICGHCSRYRSDMLEHMRRAHIKERQFTCARCPRAFKTKPVLDVHVLRMHETHKRRPAADQLQDDGTAASPVQKTYKRRPGRPVVGFSWCDICGHCSRHRSHMLEHMQRKHIKERQFPCARCPRAFKTKTYHDAHVLRMHTDDRTAHLAGERPFGCDVCAHRFWRQAQLIQHMRKTACAGRMLADEPHAMHLREKYTGEAARQ